MKLSNKMYDFLKWFALTAIPAFEVFWLTVGKVWNFPYLTEVGATIAAVGVLIAALLGVSSYNHNKPYQIDIDGYIDDEEIEAEEVKE